MYRYRLDCLRTKNTGLLRQNGVGSILRKIISDRIPAFRLFACVKGLAVEEVRTDGSAVKRIPVLAAFYGLDASVGILAPKLKRKLRRAEKWYVLFLRRTAEVIAVVAPPAVAELDCNAVFADL